MKHDWELLPSDVKTVSKFGWEPRRKCNNCGKIQQRSTEHRWMRVVGYKWLPLVGRCEGNKDGR